MLLLTKRDSLKLDYKFFKNIIKIVFSTILMGLILIYCLDFFEQNLDYWNKFKSIYVLLIVSFVATIYLISCYLLGVLKIKNYKTN